jgi:hypothetical protein
MQEIKFLLPGMLFAYIKIEYVIMSFTVTTRSGAMLRNGKSCFPKTHCRVLYGQTDLSVIKRRERCRAARRNPGSPVFGGNRSFPGDKFLFSQK